MSAPRYSPTFKEEAIKQVTERYECLAQYLIDTVGEVQDFATQRLWNYNHERPKIGLGGFIPKQRLAILYGAEDGT